MLDAPAALLTVATDAGAAEPAGAPGPAVVHQVAAVGDATATWWCAPRRRLPARAAPRWRPPAWSSAAAAGSAAPTGSRRWRSSPSLLGGVVGVSRVVTSEGWRPHIQQVGQTGTKITPDLYLACGISGAIQHFAGCAGAKHIIAINTDPAAPMMARADYAVVGDLHAVLPALIEGPAGPAVQGGIIAGCGFPGEGGADDAASRARVYPGAHRRRGRHRLGVGRAVRAVGAAALRARRGRGGGAEAALPPELFAEGICRVGDSIWQLTWRERVALRWDAGHPRSCAKRSATTARAGESARSTVCG